jgi:pyruvate dehydrogenase E2 component (dihydrolipoamide acetyltransferase)
MAEVILPQLGETVTEGTITQFFKQVGDTVAADEALFEVSTDKVDTEVPSPVSGVLLEIRVAEGDTVDVGTVIAVVGDADAAAAPTPEPAAEPTPKPAAAPTSEPAAVPTSEPAAVPTSEPAAVPTSEPAPVTAEPAPVGDLTSTPGLLSPVVRRLIRDHGIDPSTLTGTGAGGRITRDDVLRRIDAGVTAPAAAPAPAQTAPAAAPAPAQTAPAAAPAPAQTAPATRSAPAAPLASGARDQTIALSKIRRLTGEHMVASKATSPHALSVVEVDYANVDRVRDLVKAEWKATEGFSLTYLPFISRAIIDGLREFPHLNASVGSEQLIVHNYIDLGIAVDLDYEGLLAPVIRSAETKRLRAVATEIHDLADRARNRRLSPDEIQGGTFTISNNGSAGSVLTMAIINQPQVAIISTDAIVRKPVVVTSSAGDESIAIHPVGNLAMSWDHRAIDGAYAAGFLRRVKEILETRDWSSEL